VPRVSRIGWAELNWPRAVELGNAGDLRSLPAARRRVVSSAGMLGGAFVNTCLAALLVALSARADEASTSRVWVGHQVVRGHRSIPVIGDVETVVDTYTIASVTEKGGRMELKQKPCAVRFKEVMGVKTTMSDAAVARLPVARFSFAKKNSSAVAAPWSVGWDRADVDRDGNPGVTVHVDSTICGGDLYVGSETTSRDLGRYGRHD
jgi:hypothetical protein